MLLLSAATPGLRGPTLGCVELDQWQRPGRRLRKRSLVQEVGNGAVTPISGSVKQDEGPPARNTAWDIDEPAAGCIIPVPSLPKLIRGPRPCTLS